MLAVDAVALADLLDGSGPVEVAPGQTIPTEGIPDFLALGQDLHAAGDACHVPPQGKRPGVPQAEWERPSVRGRGAPGRRAGQARGRRWVRRPGRARSC